MTDINPSINGWLRVLIAITPALLAPIVSWLLSQRGAARRSKEFDSLLKRAELIERLRKLYEQKADVDEMQREILDAEVVDIVADLGALRTPERPVPVTRANLATRLRKYFLLYKQRSIKAAIYRAVFYLFLMTAISVGMVAFSEPLSGEVNGWLFVLIAGGFYLMIGFLFRAAAARENRRKLMKEAAVRTGNTDQL